MKLYLHLCFGALILSVQVIPKKTNEINPVECNAMEKTASNYQLYVGKWKKTGQGQDQNGDGRLQDNEISAPIEPSPYDTLHIYIIDKILQARIYGMQMSFEGPAVFWGGGNQFYIYPKDMPKGLSRTEQDKYALKFEVVKSSSIGDKLVLIPSIYSFMYIVYKKIE